MAANEVLKLAYAAADGALRQQDSTLTSLRTRATGLLAAAAVGTSFATSVGLYGNKSGVSSLPLWAGWSLLALVVGIGTSVMVSLWPTSAWQFGVHPTALLDNAERDIDEVYTQATRAMVEASQVNDRLLNRRFLAYRAGVFLLIVQVAALVAGAISS